MSKILKVFKYPLPITNNPGDLVPLKLPAGAMLMKVGCQRADPVLGPEFALWALVDPDEQLQELRYVVTAGTGHAIPEATLVGKDWAYVDSLITMGGQFVLHVWISTPEGKGGIEVSADNV